MPGSFGRLNGPFAIATYCAVNRSPRLVLTIQRAAASSHSSAGDRRLHQRVVVEIVVPRDASAVLENLRRERVFVLRHVAELFEQRQIAIRFHVAHRAGIAVPVPGAAEIAGALDHAQVLEAGLAQPRAHQQSAETAADDRELDVVEHRRAGEPGIDVRIFDVARELGLHFDVLRVAVGAQSLVAFRKVLSLQRVGIEVDVADERDDLGLYVHGVSGS